MKSNQIVSQSVDNFKFITMSELSFVHDIHQAMNNRHIILVYEGEFTQEITKSVLSMAERNLESVGEAENIKKKVFKVMVECLQNICKHADDHVEEIIDPSAIFLIGRNDDEYAIFSGNTITKENRDFLDGKLGQINSLDKQGLKELYMEMIKSAKLSDKGGAGLGFVDMARKSGNQLDYCFVEMDNDNYFFCLKIKITK